jgi:hypothetical protein
VFLREAGIKTLEARDVENHRGALAVPAEGALLTPAKLAIAFRAVLREEWWCRFESSTGFVHFGYDYYMYVGVSRRSAVAEDAALSRGLFVEPFTSPYHAEDQADGA